MFQADPGSGPRGTVMVVDDERHLTDLYADYLAGDFRVETAYGAREALDRLTGEVDAVLVDDGLPGMSGTTLAATVAEREADPAVVLLTETDPSEGALGAAVEEYLVKPVTATEAVTTLERVLARRAYRETRAILSRKKLRRNLHALETPAVEGEDRYRALESEIDSLERSLDRLAREAGLDRHSNEPGASE